MSAGPPPPAYLDASALVKCYDPAEAGSSAVLALVASGRDLVTSSLSAVEVASAFRRKERRGAFSAAEVALAVAAWEVHAASYTLVAPDEVVIGPARDLVLRHKLRAYDAVQLATALRVLAAERLADPGAGLEFVAADVDLAAAARAEGLAVTVV